MDTKESATGLSASKRRRRRNGANLGRHSRAGKQKSNKVSAPRSTFPAARDPSAPTTMPTVHVGVMNQSDLPYEKSLRNRANYATQNWNKSQQEVDSLLLNQSRLIEEQKQFQEQLSDSEHLQTKLIAKLTTSEQQESKMVKVLSARTKRLSSALQDEKEK